MAVAYTTRFGGGFSPDGAQIRLFQADDKAVWVLRDIRLANLTDATAVTTISVVTGVLVIPIAHEDVGARGVLVWVGRQVMEPTDQLVAEAPGHGFAALVTGYRLRLS